MGHGTHRVGTDDLSRFDHRHPVAPSDISISLDHGREDRMHSAGAEADDQAVSSELFHARGLRGNAGGLAEKPKQGRLIHAEVLIPALDFHHRLIGMEYG